jgi:hypothetical protein
MILQTLSHELHLRHTPKEVSVLISVPKRPDGVRIFRNSEAVKVLQQKVLCLMNHH